MIAGIATRQEIETFWSLADVVESNIDLTYEQAMQEQAVPEESR